MAEGVTGTLSYQGKKYKAHYGRGEWWNGKMENWEKWEFEYGIFSSAVLTPGTI